MVILFLRKDKTRMEKIDILLATYNGETFLAEQLDSILNQTYQDFNLIISDDNSNDATVKILDKYAKKDSRITFLKQEKNLGVIANFEFLLSKVQSKYFMFSDQDDIWNEDKIEKTLKKLQETNSDIMFTDLMVVDDQLNVLYNSYWELKGLKNKILKYNSFEALYLNNYITGCTMLMKKEIISKVLPLPKSTKYVLHDYWIALITSQSGKVEFLNEPTIKYRQHKNNKVGSKKKTESLKTLSEIRKLFIDVKKEHFTAFIENEDRFERDEIRALNRQALEYYENLEKHKYCNFKSWGLFRKLYQYEDRKYTLENFLILNLPILVVPIFKIRNLLK